MPSVNRHVFPSRGISFECVETVIQRPRYTDDEFRVAVLFGAETFADPADRLLFDGLRHRRAPKDIEAEWILRRQEAPVPIFRVEVIDDGRGVENGRAVHIN